MSKINKILNMETITPKERILLLAKHDTSMDLEGKEILTKSDISTIIDAWKPKDNTEVREYNKYLEGWRTVSAFRTDVQTYFLQEQIGFYKASKMVDMALWKNVEEYKKLSHLLNNGVDEQDLLQILLKNSGVEYNTVLHTEITYKLSKNLLFDLLKLNPDYATEHSYFFEEAILYEFFNEYSVIDKSSADILTQKIMESLRIDVLEQMTNFNDSFCNILKNGYFGGLPLIDIVSRWAELSGKEYIDLNELMQAFSNTEHIVYEFRKTLHEWICNGLFVNEYFLLFKSMGHDTCNSVKTNKPHCEVFSEWYKIYASEKLNIDTLIQNGKLAKAQRISHVGNYKYRKEIITGDSLYILEERFITADKFREIIIEYLDIARIVHLLKNHFFIEKISDIKQCKSIFEKAGNTYDVPLIREFEKYIEQFEDDERLLKTEMFHIGEKVDEYVYIKYKSLLPEIFWEDMMNTDTDVASRIFEAYDEKLKKVFRDEW